MSLDGVVRHYDGPYNDDDDDDDLAAAAPQHAKFSAGTCSDKQQVSSFAARPNFSVRMTRRNVLFAERKRLSDYALVFGVAGIVLMVVETELNMARVYDKNSYYSTFCKSLISLSTIILLGIMFAYHRLEVQLSAVNNCIEDWRIAMTGQMLAQIIIELTICAVHPLPGTFYFSASLRMEGEWVSASIPVDLIFSLPMFLRLFLICRTMLLHSILFSDAATRSIGALNRINFDTKFAFVVTMATRTCSDTKFVVKTLMTMTPGTVLLVFMLTFCLIASWTLRACESYYDRVYENMFNSMWMIIVTFLSIGYGDIVPNTHCGRVVAVCTGVMGSFCTALVVAVLAHKLELTRNEQFVHNFMMDNQLTKRMKNSAANVVRETWLIYKNTVLVKRASGNAIRAMQRKLLQNIHTLRNAKMKLKMLSDCNNSLVDTTQTQLDTYKLLSDMASRQIQDDARAANVDEALANIQRQLDALSTFVRHRLRSTGQRATVASDSWVPRTPAREDRTVADDIAGHRGLPPHRHIAGHRGLPPPDYDDQVTASHDVAQHRHIAGHRGLPPPDYDDQVTPSHDAAQHRQRPVWLPDNASDLRTGTQPPQ